ncbi:MAG: hypothetical protein BGO96_10120 [Micrococcales bacterium 73-15]|uniref:hypothetical protein n=1 Tax=Salana multivorans TaxID=120377 RepID=UPI00095EE7EE|nr:hypothetical protein [Salana multivorans]OJX93835.1 MAG: hypothetical protein BGO96_10120 [Micrococcales bacterium 73-15]
MGQYTDLLRSVADAADGGADSRLRDRDRLKELHATLGEMMDVISDAAADVGHEGPAALNAQDAFVSYRARLSTIQSSVVALHDALGTADTAMKTARDAHAALPSSGLSPAENALVRTAMTTGVVGAATGMVPVAGVGVVTAGVASFIFAQRAEAEREDAALAALQTLQGSLPGVAWDRGALDDGQSEPTGDGVESSGPSPQWSPSTGTSSGVTAGAIGATGPAVAAYVPTGSRPTGSSGDGTQTGRLDPIAGSDGAGARPGAVGPSPAPIGAGGRISPDGLLPSGTGGAPAAAGGLGVGAGSGSGTTGVFTGPGAGSTGAAAGGLGTAAGGLLLGRSVLGSMSAVAGGTGSMLGASGATLGAAGGSGAPGIGAPGVTQTAAGARPGAIGAGSRAGAAGYGGGASTGSAGAGSRAGTAGGSALSTRSGLGTGPGSSSSSGSAGNGAAAGGRGSGMMPGGSAAGGRGEEKRRERRGLALAAAPEIEDVAPELDDVALAGSRGETFDPIELGDDSW